MKKKGDLLYMAKTISGKLYPISYYAQLEKDKYLIIIPSILVKDPVKFRYSIISAKRFANAAVEYNLQNLNKDLVESLIG